MKVHRFIIKNIAFQPIIEITDRVFVHQIHTVLGLRVGETIELCDGRGMCARGEITAISKNSVAGSFEAPQKNSRDTDIEVTLYAAIIKRDNFELLAQKATEIGVSKIVPLITRRTIKMSVNRSRLQTILREAAEQSGRGVVPVLGEATTIERACMELDRNTDAYIFDEAGDELHGVTPTKKIRALFIGPEGGWEPGELEQLTHLKKISLGRGILRAETAAIIATHWAVTTI